MILSVQLLFLVYKIDSFPNVFIDEANGMYDAWCLAQWGVDSHLIKNPVYLQSYWGQGQSILYPILGGLSMKLFGYKIWAYRIPLIMIALLNTVVVYYVSCKYKVREKLFYILTICTSPYLLTMTRFSMDCNVAIYMISIGSMVIFAGVSELNHIKRKILLMIGISFLAASTYSYNVSWIFLPVYILVISAYLIKSGKLRISELMYTGTTMLIEMLPIIIFAIRSNIESLNQTIQILWWTSPKLPIGRRDASIIVFDKNIILNIAHNVYDGMKMFLSGTDGLSWNSVANFGPYYMFSLPFFIIGIFVLIKRRSMFDGITLAQLIAMIPIVIIVTPNYNHWMFLHIPVLYIIACGIAECYFSLNSDKKIIIAIAATYTIFFSWFAKLYFTSDRYTGFNTDAKLQLERLNTSNYERVYFASDDSDFICMIRWALPVPPYDFQSTKDYPFSLDHLTTNDLYSNFERLSEVRDNYYENEGDSLYIIQDSFFDLYDNKQYVTEDKAIYLNGRKYIVYS